MCGIFGLYNPPFPVTPEDLRTFTLSLQCRGPDEFGVFCSPHFSCAHHRLSIIDLSTGTQPMTNEDQTIWLVFNGEIYNYQPLREQLIRQGHRFHSTSDSEVLLHLYEEYQEKMLDYLHGMFAFGIYDTQKHTLFLARDHCGQKPLFYTFLTPHGFAFSSDLTSLLRLKSVPREYDEEGIQLYLQFGYFPYPYTLFQAIRKLPPAHYLQVEPHNHRIISYWKPFAYQYPTPSLPEAASHVRSLLEKAVQSHLVADVPVGIFLSGGVDSSIIATLATRLSPTPIHTFSIGFEDSRYNETPYAQQIAQNIGSIHHVAQVNPHQFPFFQDLIAKMNEPLADSSIIPTAYLCRFAHEHIKVALGGDGADELFGGYYRYRYYKLLQNLIWIPLSIRREIVNTLLRLLPPMVEERTRIGILRRLLYPCSYPSGPQQYLAIFHRVSTKQVADLFQTPTELVRSASSYLDSLWFSLPSPYSNDPLYADFLTYLPGDILSKIDQASMAFSLETRSPYLDRSIVEYVVPLPYHYKQRWHFRKYLLRLACQDLLPPHIWTRPKMGFGVPLAAWLRTTWAKDVQSILLDSSTSLPFSFSAIHHFWNLHQQKKEDLSYLLFALLVLRLWEHALPSPP